MDEKKTIGSANDEVTKKKSESELSENDLKEVAGGGSSIMKDVDKTSTWPD
jgi:hypothetical protein